MSNNKLVNFLPIIALIIGVSTFASIAQAKSPHSYGQIAYGGEGSDEKLNLTAEQKAKKDQLSQATRTQIEAILTPEQLQKYKQIEGNREAKSDRKGSLNLTADQKTKIQAIRKANREQFRAVLTPAQQAQIAQGGMGGGWKKLNLTADQKAKMKELRAASRTQMDAILTPDQQQQSKVSQERRQARSADWKSLNLTAEQKTKIEAIRKNSQTQFRATLTPEQQAKMKTGRHHKDAN